jgi:hypothetical protein
MADAPAGLADALAGPEGADTTGGHGVAYVPMERDGSADPS